MPIPKIFLRVFLVFSPSTNAPPSMFLIILMIFPRIMIHSTFLTFSPTSQDLATFCRCPSAHIPRSVLTVNEQRSKQFKSEVPCPVLYIFMPILLANSPGSNTTLHKRWQIGQKWNRI
ncbi:hypothetical protein FA15DRAFT_61599 [Coprinopsis marcescibilis]|uniref:Uncharacterized protein n=1 Tax=Coprinopsis marcescibilis TaxID=230819 RepID=A0A5C3LIQ7_COPMA|nr:hypothetical protein FA15DRAFT_61599 [Coprinopsis marcescibilis]